MKQGHMDGLCGLYASFNLLKHLFKFHDQFDFLLFDVLKKSINISNVWNGTNIYELKIMLLNGITFCNKFFNKKFHLTILPHSLFINNRKTLLHTIDYALSFNKTRILIGVSGLIGNHWTVITGISKDKTLYHILDSGPRNAFKINKKLISTRCYKWCPRKYIYFDHVMIVHPINNMLNVLLQS